MAVSAASRRLSELEARLGTPLLFRTVRGVAPTAAGESLARHADNLLRLADRAAEDMQQFASGDRGLVGVSANPSAVAQFLPDVLSGFRTAFPDIRIALRERMSDAVVQDVFDGQADIGIFSAEVNFDAIETFPFLSDHLCVVAPLGHPLSSNDALAFDDILDFPHVALEDGSSLIQRLIDTAAKQRCALDIVVRVRSFDAVRQMVAKDMGLAVLPLQVVAPYAGSDGLVALPLTDGWAERRFRVGVRHRRSLAPAAERFLEHVLAAAKH